MLQKPIRTLQSKHRSNRVIIFLNTNSVKVASIDCNNIGIIFCRWYFRKIKRIEAEKKLLLPENEHGAFLIRDSESRHNDFSLSGNKIYSLLYLTPRQIILNCQTSPVHFNRILLNIKQRFD
jgi:hypothetical protein